MERLEGLARDSPTPRPQADHRQGSHRLSSCARKTRQAHRGVRAADDDGELTASRIQRRSTRTRTSRWSWAISASGKDMLVRVHSRVHDRRRAAFDSLRLRGAARRCDGADRARRARRLSLLAPRRTRHRACQQAARVRAAGSRRRYGRGEPRARACRSTNATTASARRSWPTSACARCA